MTDMMTFADLLAAANEPKTGHGPGQWTPAACRVWREAEPEASRLLEAALAWELAAGRKAADDGRGDGSGEGGWLEFLHVSPSRLLAVRNRRSHDARSKPRRSSRRQSR
jgi:hypothetical protein